MSIKVTDYNETYFENEKSYFVSLNLIPISNTSGNVVTGEWSKSIKSSNEFKNLSILSSGLFKISASAKNLTGDSSQEFKISNLVKFANLESNNYSVYENFTIKVDLIGEDEKPYILDCQVEIKEIQDIIWFQKKGSYFDGQNLTFEGYSQKSGIIAFQVTTSNSSSDFISNPFKLNFSNAKIKLSFDEVVKFI